jgi:hypothetical protein
MLKHVRGPLIDALLLSASAATIVVFVIRLHAALSLGGVIPSSGVEGSGALGVFRVCKRAVLYHDFSDSTNLFIFNYLFYEFYGHVVALFGNCARTVPLVGRIVTACLLLLTWLLLLLFPVRGVSRLEKFAIATAVLSPYVGWWAFALRPDIGAMLFLAACLVSLVRISIDRQPLIAAISAAFLAVACDFKQTMLLVAPVTIAYVGWHNRKLGAVHAAVLILGVASPVLFYSIPLYLDHALRVSAAEHMQLEAQSTTRCHFCSRRSPS